MLRVLLGAAAAAAALLASPSLAQAPGKYERLAAALWSAVNDHYYDPHFRGADWAGVREGALRRARGVGDDAEFQALANDMLSVIGSSHLHASPPSNTGPAAIGARFVTLAGQTVVRETAPLSDAAAQGLRPGDRLRSDPAALRGALGSRAQVEVETCAGRRRSLSIRREHAFWPPEHPGFRWSRLTTGAGTSIGYIRADRFDDGAAALADSAMSELAETQALIIDLRANSGGNASALRLASYFAPGAEPGVILLARPYLQALGHSVTPADIAAVPRVDAAYTDQAVFEAVSAHGGGAAFWVEAVAAPYRRPVIVLIGEDTGSAAEGFAWYMRTRTQARLIGRPTEGALLSAERFDLGEGWTVTVPVHGLWGGDGVDYGDRAVTPHQTLAAWTRADLCAGRDPDLAAAFRAIEG